MEGRRRRAQRLTQNIDEQPVQGAVRQEDEPQASLPYPEQPTHNQTPADQTGSGTAVRRRRPVQPLDEIARETPRKPMPKAGLERRQTLQAEARNERIAQAVQTAENVPKRHVKKKKKITAPRALSKERFQRAANVSARAGKKALEGLGGALLLVLMAAGEAARKLIPGAKKMIAAARNGAGRQPGEKTQDSSASAQQEYELELIRPQDYHGRGQAHAQKAAAAHHSLPALQKKAPQARPAGRETAAGQRSGQTQRALLLNRLLSAALVCVALFSAWQIGSIVVRSVKTNLLNDSLSRERAALIEAQGTPEPDEAPESSAETAVVMADIPTPTPAPVQMFAAAANTATSAPDVVRTTKYHQMGGDALPEMAALYEKNRDLVAWIQIPDVLDLPVVYRNNSYYLNRDFNKQKNASGTIFLDVNHPFKEKTQNLLLHGHNMKDGTMFGRLAQYLYDDTYIRNHPFIYFDTLWKKEQYVIFAMLNVSLDTKNERFFNYFTHDTFSSDAEFQAYIRQLQLRSYYAIPIDVNPGDALLTLSTCLEDDRLVIVARRLRENETRSDLRTLIRMTTKQ